MSDFASAFDGIKPAFRRLVEMDPFPLAGTGRDEVPSPEHDIRPGTGVLSDQTIELTSARSRKAYAAPLRRVAYQDPVTKNRYVFVTNNTTWVAQTIADIYKSRWQIELFFKWIKQHLKVKRFVGRSKNAVPAAHPGVYLLSESDRPLYVGRTRDVRGRLSDHRSSAPTRATLAVKMARIAANRPATYTSGNSATHLYSHDLTFRTRFDEARARICAMQVRWVDETDDVRQAMLEIYAAVDLDTILREGPEAGRVGGYNSFRTS